MLVSLGYRVIVSACRLLRYSTFGIFTSRAAVQRSASVTELGDLSGSFQKRTRRVEDVCFPLQHSQNSRMRTKELCRIKNQHSSRTKFLHDKYCLLENLYWQNF